MKFKIAGLVGLLLLGLSAAPYAASGPLRDFDGSQRSIDEFAQGRWLVVMIWASDCHICNQEIVSYVDLHAREGGRTLDLLGISIDGEARELDAEAFIERHEVGFPNLIGEPQDVFTLYYQQTGAAFRGTPTFLVYNPAGQLKAAQAGGVPTRVIQDFIASNAD